METEEMKEFRGTKTGDGKLEWVRSNFGFQVLTADSRTPICETVGKKTMDEQIANAQLIAAAPDLLEALLSLMDGVANLPPLVAIDGVLKTEWEQGLKAINKALGK